jgi:hypothetical protein
MRANASLRHQSAETIYGTLEYLIDIRSADLAAIRSEHTEHIIRVHTVAVRVLRKEVHAQGLISRGTNLKFNTS